MHIAINTSPMTGGHSGRGIGLYTKELIEALAIHEPAHRYSYFSLPSGIPAECDVVHLPFFDPFILTLPWTVSKPTVVTVHDLIPIVHAAHFPKGIRGWFKWQIQRAVVKNTAAAIITDSEASRRDIERVLDFRKDRIFPIPLAPRSFPVNSAGDLTQEVKKKYDVNGEFILYVGDVNWNKNIPGVLNAYSSYIKGKKDKPVLVLVGKAFPDYSIAESASIHAQIIQLGLTGLVKMPGFVPDEALGLLYRVARVLLYPSFAEGFGFPVLEAMAAGCPVVTSSVSSLPEIAGPAILVNPHRAEDIRRGLDMVLSLSSDLRSKLVAQGAHWAKQFTWARVAHETVRVYEKTHGNYSGF